MVRGRGPAWPAALACLALVAAACRTAMVHAPPPARAPAPAPQPPAAPPARVEAPPEREEMRPPLVRVSLQTGSGPSLPEPGRRYVVACGETAVLRGPLSASLRATPAAIQIGAFGDPANARGVLTRLQATGFTAEESATAGGLVRVVVRAAAGETSEALAERLRRAGWSDARAVPAADTTIVVRGEGEATMECREAHVVPLDPAPVRVGGKSVRGELRLRPGAAGVAVINVLGLDQYLRGVVPAEMGPRAFPAIEALKAQAVAARTYAVAHLGEFDAAGYDLCDSQSCQVYAGVEAEHPLTDRAIRETAGEIAVFAGTPIDAMYHSTCGGRTEDAAAVFPERAAPYLEGVRCSTDGAVVVGASSRRGEWFGHVERLAAVGDAVAASLGVAARPAAMAARLGGRAAHDGAAGLAAAFAVPDLAPLHVEPGEAAERRLVALLSTFRLPLPERTAGVTRARWEMALVVRLAQLSGAIRAVTGFVAPDGAGALLVDERGEKLQAIAGTAAGIERRGDAWRAGPVVAPVGSPATAWCVGQECVVVEVEPKPDADGASAWSWWARELTLEEIGRRLGFAALADVEVLRRGESGRALAVALRGGAGRREMAAYPFRRTLDLPDTLFVIQRRSSPSGPVLRFLGRGWGHGIGMCQNGAYGKALAGADYRRILGSYYTGIEVVRWTGMGGGR